jgi:SAM-dependent methyltransferase
MSTSQVPDIFDHNLLKLHRARAAAGFSGHDFLLRDMAEILCGRLEYIKRKFPVTLDLGAHTGILAEILQARGGVETLVQSELSEFMLHKAHGIRLVADEELLPFAENSFDLVMSVGALHWVNDLAGTLAQVQRVLKPDGLFLGILPGGQTLKELRASFEQAEMRVRGGISPRVSPFIDVQSGGMLLQRAGFALPVIDSEMVTVEYSHPLKLMRELRGMGEANSLHDGAKNFTPCSLLMAAADNYLRDFSNGKQRVEASFEFITMTGWKPHASQQQPSKRGSGKVSLTEVI